MTEINEKENFGYLSFQFCREKLPQKIPRRIASEQNTNRDKRNRKHCENRDSKSNKPKFHSGTIISVREKAGTSTAN